MNFRYIDYEQSKNLHKYKYMGSDNSVSYNYLLSPLAEFLVKFFPRWIQ